MQAQSKKVQTNFKCALKNEKKEKNPHYLVRIFWRENSKIRDTNKIEFIFSVKIRKVSFEKI